MGVMYSQAHQVAGRTERWQVMAVKGLRFMPGTEHKAKKCQLLLLCRMAMERREAKRSPVGPFLQGPAPQGEAWTSSMDTTGGL